jgi:hypothetical protein
MRGGVMAIDTGTATPTRPDGSAAAVDGAPPDPQRPPYQPAASEATRYLCAGVHFPRRAAGRRARRLRDVIVEQVVDNDACAIGVSPGVDLRPVVANAREAIRRVLVRDIVLAVLLVALLVIAVALQPPGLVVVVFVLLAAEVVYAEAVHATWGVVGRRFSRDTFDPERELMRGSSMPEVLARVAEAQDGNVTIYSGFSPFVGAGFDHGGWSFALNVSRGADRFGTPGVPGEFDASELYDRVAGGIKALGIPGLSIEDRLYVDGRTLHRDRLFLAKDGGRPSTLADQATVARFIGGGAESARHYQTIRVVTWGASWFSPSSCDSH